MKFNKGYTLIEVLMVAVVLTIIASVAFIPFKNLSQKEALEKDAAGLIALLRQAQFLSISSKNTSVFGVRLLTDRVVLFKGSYQPESPEQVFVFSDKIFLTAYSLNGGGSEIIFSRLKGETNNFGTINLSLKNNSASTTITVLKTGIIQ